MQRPSMRNPFRYFKTSPEITRLAVMMSVRYPLSLRQVEDLLHERGIHISYEKVRAWRNQFGPGFAVEIRKRRIYDRSFQPGDGISTRFSCVSMANCVNSGRRSTGSSCDRPASVHNHFNQERHLRSRQTFKLDRSLALAEWHQNSDGQIENLRSSPKTCTASCVKREREKLLGGYVRGFGLTAKMLH